MKRCSVAFCYNHRLLSSKFFYRFPKNIKYKQKWIEFVKKTRSDWPVDDHVNVSEVICEDHFHPEDYHNYYQHQLGFSTQLRLRATAVPSLPPKNEQVPPIVLRKPRRKRSKPKTKSSKSQKSSKGRNVNRKQEYSPSSKAQNEDMNIVEELLDPGDGVSVEGMFEMVCVQPEVSVCSEVDETTQASTLFKNEKDDMSGTLLQMRQEHNYAKKGSDIYAKLKVLSPNDLNSLINTITSQDVAEHEGSCVGRNDHNSLPVLKEQRNFKGRVVNLGVTIKQEKTDDAQIYEQEYPTMIGKSQGKNGGSVKNISFAVDEDVYDTTRVVKQENGEHIKGESVSEWDHIRKERESNPEMIQLVYDRDGNIMEKEKEFPMENNQFMCDTGSIKQEKIESSWDSDEYEFHPIGNNILCAEGIKQEETSWRKEDFVSGLEGIFVQERSSQNSESDMCNSFRYARQEVSVARTETENILMELEEEEKEEEEEEEDSISEYKVVVSQESQSITKPALEKHVSAKKGGHTSSIGQGDDLLRTSIAHSNSSTEIPLGKLESIFVENNCSYDEHNLGKDQQKSCAREHDIKRMQEVMNDHEQYNLDHHYENVNQVKGTVQIDMMRLQKYMEIKDKSENNETSQNVDSACVAEPNAKSRGVTQNTWQRRVSTRRRKKPMKFHEYGEEELRSSAAMEKPLQKKQNGSLNRFPKSKKLGKQNMKYPEDQYCKGCKKLFSSSAKLKNHQNKHPILSCKFCSKVFCEPVTYRAHILEHFVVKKKSFFSPVERKKIMNILSEGEDYSVACKKNDLSTAQTKDSTYSSSVKVSERNFQYLKPSFS